MWVVAVGLVAIWFSVSIAFMCLYLWKVHGPGTRCQCGKFAVDADIICAEGPESIIHERWRCYPAREVIIDPEKAL